MKTFNEFILEHLECSKLPIIERLKLNKDSKIVVSQNILKRICEILYIEDEVDEEEIQLVNFIKKWIKKNNVKDIEAISSDGELKSLSQGEDSTYEFLKSIITVDDEQAADNKDLYDEDIHRFRYDKKLGTFDGYCDGTVHGFRKEIWSDGDMLICNLDYRYIYIRKTK